MGISATNLNWWKSPPGFLVERHQQVELYGGCGGFDCFVFPIFLNTKFRLWFTLQGTNISPWKGIFEDDFPCPQVGYVNSLEGMI